MKLKKIIVAVSLDEATQRPFHYLEKMPIPLDSEIHLVHLVTETFYAKEMQFQVVTSPPVEDRPKIESEIVKKLLKLKKEIFPHHTNVSTKVIFDPNIKAAFVDYTEKQKPDLIIVATRGRHGIKSFFDSSFAQHQLKYSPANVLVLR